MNRAAVLFLAALLALGVATCSACSACRKQDLPPPAPDPPIVALSSPITAKVEKADTSERVTITPPGIVFDVPKTVAGVSYTGPKLAEVRACTTEWDQEFAEVANDALPFDALAVHVGSEPFCGGVSFADMHVRAYVLASPKDAVVRAIREHGKKTVARLEAELQSGQSAKETESPSPSDPRSDFPEFTSVRLAYRRFYGDYGGIAHVSFFVRAFGEQTLVLVFMWTRTPVYEADGERIDPLASTILSVRKL